MQLARGGNDRRLQNASLLTVLPLLAGSKVVFEQDIAELTAAYLVLRRAENALQMIRDEQTHTLPKDAQDRARLALNMGLADWSAAFELIESTRDKVAVQFEALLFGAADAQRRDEDIGVVWLDSDNAKIGEELKLGGFPQAAIAAVTAELEAFRGAAIRLDEAGRRLYIILARLLKSAAQHADPATVVQRVLRVLGPSAPVHRIWPF